MILKNKCLICGGTKINKAVKKGLYNLFLCNNCNLFFVYPQPPNRKLNKIYSIDKGYSHSRIKLNTNLSSDLLNKALYFKQNNKKKILDVGCGCGDFLFTLKHISLIGTGIEISKDLAKEGIRNGLKIINNNFDNIKLKRDSFEGIYLGDILEHVKNPRTFLRKCNYILKDKGKMIISTPNTNSFFVRATYFIYKKTGLMWSHPTPPSIYSNFLIKI